MTNAQRLLRSVPAYVPPTYRPWVASAAAGTGLPTTVVAAQIDDESGFNPNVTSGAGAEGIAQFLPSTFRSYSSGSPFNTNNALTAYTKYMSTLLAQYHGNIRNALAAYNAGPGNLAAGYGYADAILGRAGMGSTATASGGTGTATSLGPGPNGGIVRPGGTTTGQSQASPLLSDWSSLITVDRTAPPGANVDVSYGEDVSFWGWLTGRFKWAMKQNESIWNTFTGDLSGAATVVNDSVSFMDLLAKFLFNPYEWLRAVEFVTGMIIMAMGLRVTIIDNGSRSRRSITRALIADSPVGRAQRMAAGHRAGVHEGQTEHARLKARKQTREREAKRDAAS